MKDKMFKNMDEIFEKFDLKQSLLDGKKSKYWNVIEMAIDSQRDEAIRKIIFDEQHNGEFPIKDVIDKIDTFDKLKHVLHEEYNKSVTFAFKDEESN